MQDNVIATENPRDNQNRFMKDNFFLFESRTSKDKYSTPCMQPILKRSWFINDKFNHCKYVALRFLCPIKNYIILK